MGEVRLSNITKIYDTDKVVKDFTLKIQDKEFLVLVGPSGCGKSTILRMIAGLEEISQGELFINNIKVNDLPPKQRDIAMVFQNYALYPHMTVFENMGFGLKLQKFSKPEIKSRVYKSAEILGLTEYLNRKPRELSGGQRQRVAVGRAIVRNPSVFLFDEPLSNLDAKLRVQMRAELIKLHKKIDTTMIYVTHDQTEAMTMGDRIAVLHKGILQQCDTPLNIYNHPVNKFVAEFIGSPSMNFIEVTVKKEKKIIVLDTENGKIETDKKRSDFLNNNNYINKKLFMGIRPEHIELGNTDETKNIITAYCEVVEPMGNETYCHFSFQNKNITVRFDDFIPKTDTKIRLKINPEKIYLFDKDTEKSIFNENYNTYPNKNSIIEFQNVTRSADANL